MNTSSSASSSELQFDLENLSQKDQERVLKKANEIQQQQLFRTQILELSEFCFKKCFTKIKSVKDKADQVCMVNCVERFFDATELVMKTQFGEQIEILQQDL